MSNFDIVRAWKDEAYRQSLSDEQRAALPANPAGMIELTDNELSQVAGGDHGFYTVNKDSICWPCPPTQYCYNTMDVDVC